MNYRLFKQGLFGLLSVGYFGFSTLSQASVISSPKCTEALKQASSRRVENQGPSSSDFWNEFQDLLTKRHLQIADPLNFSWDALTAFLQSSRNEAKLETSNLPTQIDEDLRNINDNYLKHYGRFIVITNEQNDIVGTAGLLRTGANTAELRKVYLAPEARGGGIGKLLVQHIVEWAREQGYREISLNTHPQLQLAISLYTSVGFVKTNEVIPERPKVMIFKRHFNQEPLAKRLSRREDKIEYFAELKKQFLKAKSKIKEILLEIETEAGAEYELRQVEDLLENVEDLEISNLQQIKPLKNVAVYGSTNIPLYTLMMHAFIPVSVSEHVWFRTPSATRSIYSRLFDTLVSSRPPGTFEGIHILTDPKDIQYDNFQKRHVLGLNNKGKKSLRPISEVVLFTGSPETGREILRSNVRELSKIESKSEKQVFLAFGAGINPLIITKDAKGNLDAAMNAALDSVRINSGQDCIAPNLVLVDEAIADEYIAGLKERLSLIKVDAQKRGENLITPLYFSETVTGLVEYRDQFASHLMNSEQAKINSETREVTPHLFVFDYKDYEEVPLKEHFAPFLVVFKYKDREEVKKMVLDPRVQNKVMYASVFGDTQATTETSRMVQLLQETRHTVSVNFSIYADESGNMPFGGLGPDSSTANWLEKNESEIKLETAQRPLLFSEDAARYFSDAQVPKATLQTQELARSFVTELMKGLDQPLDSMPFHLKPWSKVTERQIKNRPTGLATLREVMAQKGLSRVSRFNGEMDDETKKKMVDFYGVPLLFPKENQKMERVPGVVLHNGLPAEIPLLLNKYRGDINPYLGRGMLAGLLKNKLSEYYLAEAIQPGSMAATESFKTLDQGKILSQNFHSQRIALVNKIGVILRSGKPLTLDQSKDLRQEFEKIIRILFLDIRKYYPQGAFFKNFGELATADLGIMITTFSTNPIHIAQQFVMRMEEILKNHRAEQPLLEAFSVEPYETGSKFLAQILEKPEGIMVQVREDLLRTEQGQNMEFRVSFMDGEPFNSKLRFSREYYPREAKKAFKFVKDFFAKAPPEIRHLSGGADVVFTRDGRTLFMEFNFGGSDGTLFPTFFIMDNHEATSKLVGKPTPFYARMLALASKPKEEVISFFRSLKNHLEPWHKSSLDSLSAVEFGRWYRDEKIRQWQKTPNVEKAQSTMAEIVAVLTSRKEVGEDIEKIILGAKEFYRREHFDVTYKL